MTDTKKFMVASIQNDKLRLYLARSEDPRALLQSVRKEVEAMTGVPRMSMSQAAVAAWRDWLRMRLEAERGR